MFHIHIYLVEITSNEMQSKLFVEVARLLVIWIPWTQFFFIFFLVIKIYIFEKCFLLNVIHQNFYYFAGDKIYILEDVSRFLFCISSPISAFSAGLRKKKFFFWFKPVFFRGVMNIQLQFGIQPFCWILWKSVCGWILMNI